MPVSDRGSDGAFADDGPLACFPARGNEFPLRALGERVHPPRRELVVRGAELGSRVDPALLAAQPLAVGSRATVPPDRSARDEFLIRGQS
jgi:hypothetical protein